MNFPDLAERLLQKGKQDILLIGEGGLGKTCSLLELCRRLLKTSHINTRDGKTLLPIYIRLADCNVEENRNNLIHYIVANMMIEKFDNAEKQRVREENLKIMFGQDGHFHYVFLLDGGNENNSLARLVGEINGLRDFPNVSIILSSRKQAVKDHFHEWTRMQLEPLDCEWVRGLLADKGISPVSEELLTLLTNPFYLSRFLKMSDGGLHTALEDPNRFSLLKVYTAWSVEKQQAVSAPGLELGQILDQAMPKQCFQLALVRQLVFTTKNDHLCAIALGAFAKMLAAKKTYAGSQSMDAGLFNLLYQNSETGSYLVSSILCDQVFRPIDLASPAGGERWEITHELFRDFFAALYLEQLHQNASCPETAADLLEALSHNLPEDVLVLFADALRGSEKGLMGSLNEINGWIGSSEINKQNERLMKNLVRLYAEDGPKLEGVDFRDRNLKQASFSGFTHLLGCCFDDAVFSSETMAFPVSDHSDKGFLLAFPESNRVVRFHHNRLQVFKMEDRTRRETTGLNASVGDLLFESEELDSPALMERADDSHVILVHLDYNMLGTCRFTLWDIDTYEREETELRELCPQFDMYQEHTEESENELLQSPVQLWFADGILFFACIPNQRTSESIVHTLDIRTGDYSKLDSLIFDVRNAKEDMVSHWLVSYDALHEETRENGLQIIRGTNAPLIFLPPEMEWEMVMTIRHGLAKVFSLWKVLEKEALRYRDNLEREERPLKIDDLKIWSAVWNPEKRKHILLCSDEKDFFVREFDGDINEERDLVEKGFLTPIIQIESGVPDTPKMIYSQGKLLIYTLRVLCQVSLDCGASTVLYQASDVGEFICSVEASGDFVWITTVEDDLYCLKICPKGRNLIWKIKDSHQVEFTGWFGLCILTPQYCCQIRGLEEESVHLEKTADDSSVMFGKILSVKRLPDDGEFRTYRVLSKGSGLYRVYHVEKRETEVVERLPLELSEDKYRYVGLCGRYCIAMSWDRLLLVDDLGQKFEYPIQNYANGMKERYMHALPLSKYQMQFQSWLDDHFMWICGRVQDLGEVTKELLYFLRVDLLDGTVDDSRVIPVLGRLNEDGIWDNERKVLIVSYGGENRLAIDPLKGQTESMTKSEVLLTKGWDEDDFFVSYEPDTAYLYNAAGEMVRWILPFGHDVTGSTFRGTKWLSEEQLDILKDYGAKIE